MVVAKLGVGRVRGIIVGAGGRSPPNAPSKFFFAATRLEQTRQREVSPQIPSIARMINYSLRSAAPQG